MLTLGGKIKSIRNIEPRRSRTIFRLSNETNLPIHERAVSALFLTSTKVPEGYGAYVVYEDQELLTQSLSPRLPVVVLPNLFRYLAAEDIIALSPASGRIRTLYRRCSKHNSFLVTERCDNYCLMCSQPPKAINDDWIVDEILEAIPLVSRQTEELGFTGGEPTILGDRFIDILVECKKSLPNTAIHVLSNGRRFSDSTYARKWAAVRHQDLVVGIPIYGDVSATHNYVVQATGAFDETIRGILNLKRFEQKVEIRVVIHQQTYKHLPRLAEFIARNLLFVDHIALMGLEIIGFTRANLDILWIDPVQYQRELVEAVRILDSAGLQVSLYNHQLCLLDRWLWPFAVRSISDWKNEYVEQCASCQVKNKCGGFFASAKFKRSEHIAPIISA